MTEHFLRSVGANVRDRRTQLGITQQQLADAVGLTRSSITNIESGRQVLETRVLVTMCRVMAVSSDWLLALDTPLNAKPSVDILTAVRAEAARSAVAELRKAFDAAADRLAS